MDKEVSADVAPSDLSGQAKLRQYVEPSIKVMDEAEVLSAFQVTVASISWWIM